MQLRTEVEIEASSQRVWDALVDFRAYPQWNPFITQISGELSPGARLRVTLSLPEGEEYHFKPELLRCEPCSELRWRGRLVMRALFQGEHFFQLKEVEPNRTRFVQGEDFSGFAVKYMSKIFTQTTRGFVYMNQALKRHVEKA
jgi:hypothetical protein